MDGAQASGCDTKRNEKTNTTVITTEYMGQKLSDRSCQRPSSACGSQEGTPSTR